VHFHAQFAFFHEFWLVDNPQHEGTELQLVCAVWMDSAPEMLAFDHVTPFSFAQTCPFCFTTCD
jgi:hypothetical protein